MIEVRGLRHVYDNGVVGIKGVTFSVDEGQMVALVGASGSGKSTLLRCVNRLLEPVSGSVLIDGEDILNSPESRCRKIRRKMGMVFQNFNLLHRSLVVENVLIGRLGHISTIRCLLPKLTYSRNDIFFALNCLQRVGIEDLAYRRVDTLSGGQQQRVGIARALAQEPSIILADEPVSNLDSSRKTEIMNLLWDIHRHDGITTLVSLHDLDLAKKYCGRIIGLVKGGVVFDGRPEDFTEEKSLGVFA